MKPIEQWMRDNHIKENEPFKLLLWGEYRTFIIKRNKIKPDQLVLRSDDVTPNPSTREYLELVGYILISNGKAPIHVLKPCPICGKTEDVHTEYDEDQGYFSVQCRRCKVKTVECCSEYLATSIWNNWKRSKEQ